MDTDRLVADLERLGLTEYQSRTYVATVRQGRATFSTVADEAGIPQQRVYDVMDDLAELGLLEIHESNSGKEAVALPPSTSLADLRDRRVSDLTDRIDTVAEPLDDAFQQVDTSGGFVTVVSHQRSMNRHLRNAIEAAEWWLFLSLPADFDEGIVDAIEAAIDRGVTTRILAQGGANGPAVDRLGSIDGASVRHRPSADLLVAADRTYGVFRGVAAQPVTRPSLVTRDRTLVEMLQRYAEQFWAGSTVVRADLGYPRRYLMPWQAIDEIRDARSSDTELVIRVEGHETTTGREDTWTGRVVDITVQGAEEVDFAVVLPEVVRVTIETDDGPRTIGGWDATLEDVAAHGIEIDTH